MRQHLSLSTIASTSNHRNIVFLKRELFCKGRDDRAKRECIAQPPLGECRHLKHPLSLRLFTPRLKRVGLVECEDPQCYVCRHRPPRPPPRRRPLPLPRPCPPPIHRSPRSPSPLLLSSSIHLSLHHSLSFSKRLQLYIKILLGAATKTCAGVPMSAGLSRHTASRPTGLATRGDGAFPACFHCLFSTFYCLFTTFHCLFHYVSLPFKCLFSTFHCLFSTFHCCFTACSRPFTSFSLTVHCLFTDSSLPSRDSSLPFRDISLPLRWPRSARHASDTPSAATWCAAGLSVLTRPKRWIVGGPDSVDHHLGVASWSLCSLLGASCSAAVPLLDQQLERQLRWVRNRCDDAPNQRDDHHCLAHLHSISLVGRRVRHWYGAAPCQRDDHHTVHLQSVSLVGRRGPASVRHRILVAVPLAFVPKTRHDCRLHIHCLRG